jgi:hypothetical protein
MVSVLALVFHVGHRQNLATMKDRILASIFTGIIYLAMVAVWIGSLIKIKRP